MDATRPAWPAQFAARFRRALSTTGLAALILAKHPEFPPFQVKTVLFACANNVAAAEQGAQP